MEDRGLGRSALERKVMTLARIHGIALPRARIHRIALPRARIRRIALPLAR